MILFHTQFHDCIGSRRKMAVFSVNRHSVPGLQKGIDQFDFLLAGVAGNMGILEKHFRSPHGQLIDDPGNRFFISRYGIGT